MRNLLINNLSLRSLLVFAAGIFMSAYLSAQDLPDKPEIKRVSFDTSYHDAGYRIIIEWLPSDSADVIAYKVYYEDNNGGGIIIDSVSSLITDYQYVIPDLNNLLYSVTSVDIMGNESLRTPDEYSLHRPILATVEFDTCELSNIIRWNPYEGWGEKTSVYRLYVAEGNNSFELLEIFDPFQAQYEFIHRNINENSSYRYLVEAVENQHKYISHSNIAVGETMVPDPPAFILIDYVDVVENGSVKISVTADISGQINDFQLLRSQSSNDGFHVLDTYYSVIQETSTFMDQVATSGNQYFYRLDAIYQPEGCTGDRVVASSNIGSTILLNGEENNNIVSLVWTPYQDFPAGVDSYAIMREIVGHEPVEVGRVGPETNFFNEDIMSILNGPQTGEIHYRVIATAIPNPIGPFGMSHSNVVTISLNTTIYMPNAFIPNGTNPLNRTFKPVIDFAPKSFLMTIYDRSGGKLFQTTDPYQGWDGSFRGGGMVNEGVYVYHVQYTEFTGSTKSMTGNVTVVYH